VSTLDRRQGRSTERLSRSVGRRTVRESRRPGQRADAELLLHRASMLPDLDRLLLEEALRGGRSPRELAMLHRTTPRRMREHLRRLRAVLAEPGFVFVSEFGDRLPAAVRPVAESHFLGRMTLRQCACRHGLTLHQVRQALAVARSVRLLLEAARHAPATPQPAVAEAE
jgi:hypothetical protein